MIGKLKVFKRENGLLILVSDHETKEKPELVLRTLAICFRELNKATRKNEKISKAKFWETFSADGLKDQNFRFILKYDELNEYIYEYYFSGCSLE